jgi:hypothetical protein
VSRVRYTGTSCIDESNILHNISCIYIVFLAACFFPAPRLRPLAPTLNELTKEVAATVNASIYDYDYDLHSINNFREDAASHAFYFLDWIHPKAWICAQAIEKMLGIRYSRHLTLRGSGDGGGLGKGNTRTTGSALSPQGQLPGIRGIGGNDWFRQPEVAIEVLYAVDGSGKEGIAAKPDPWQTPVYFSSRHDNNYTNNFRYRWGNVTTLAVLQSFFPYLAPGDIYDVPVDTLVSMPVRGLIPPVFDGTAKGVETIGGRHFFVFASGEVVEVYNEATMPSIEAPSSGVTTVAASANTANDFYRDLNASTVLREVDDLWMRTISELLIENIFLNNTILRHQPNRHSTAHYLVQHGHKRLIRWPDISEPEMVRRGHTVPPIAIKNIQQLDLLPDGPEYT